MAQFSLLPNALNSGKTERFGRFWPARDFPLI
jgi:hypothetical protein